MDGIGAGKVGMLLVAAASATGTAVEVVTKAETAFLNVPLSMLYVAIAGTMIGVFLLPAKEAARVNTDPNASLRKRALYLIFSLALIVAAILCYAFISAWAVQVVLGIVRTLTRLTVDESLILPATGLVGVGIRPWLPALLKAVERRADRIIGGDP